MAAQRHVPRPGHRPGSAQPRIAIAGFQHETNSFSPLPATFADFIREDGWPGLTESGSLVSVFSGTNIPIGGFIDAMSPCVELVPILWASAEPSNLVETAAFEQVSERILGGIERALPLDGIYLDLHGAMVTEDHEDGEGELLRRVRELAGPGTPVAVSLDLHANITSEMVAHADVITVFRTYPHLDMAQTGARAGDQLLEVVESGRTPFTTFRKLPFLIPLQAQCTDDEPVRSLYRNLPSSTQSGGMNAEIALGFPPADIAMCGPAAVATAFSRAGAERMADELERRILDSESHFLTELEQPATAVRRAMRTGRPGRPAVIADVQDNSGAGASSDTTALLAALVHAGAGGAALAAVCDPEAVAAAHAAGVGSEFSVVLGGKTGGAENPGFPARCRVAALADGRFDYRGEMMRGVRANLGPTAALEIVDRSADVRVVVTRERVQCLDRAIFSHLGIDPVRMSILAIKSTVHFRADFAPFAGEVIPVEAPGYNPCRLGAIPYRRLREGVRLL